MSKAVTTVPGVYIQEIDLRERISIPKAPRIFTLDDMRQAIEEGQSWEAIKEQLPVWVNLDEVKANYDDIVFKRVVTRTKLGRLLYG